MSDQQLLREYVDGGSERAFQSLVQQHVDLVYSTALRRLGDAGLAEEVTQNVFVALARKAPFLGRDAPLAAWLHKTTLLEARHRLRKELRRKRREETAVALGTTMKEEDSSLKSLSPVLDEALMELREKDRHAVLLRFFENKNLHEVGEALGVGEDAAQKRVAKALEQLTHLFRRRGYNVPAATTIGAVLHGATQAAPAGLASVAAQTALQSAGAMSLTGLGLWFAKFVGLTKTQTAALCLLASATPIVYEWNALSHAAAGREQRRVELTELRQALAGYQAERARLERELRFVDDSILQLGVEQARRTKLASSVPPDNDPRLYRWSETSAYVRLPKSLFSQIKLYDPAMESNEQKDNHTKWSPALTKDGKISAVLLETMGLDHAASAHAKQAFLDFAQGYRDLEESHTLLTNTLPEGVHIDGSYRTSITSAFPSEGKALEARLRAAVEQTMDKDRADALWNYLRGAFYEFNDFGARTRTLILHFDKNGSILITHPDEGFMTQLVALNEVPQQFKPFVEEWKSTQKH